MSSSESFSNSNDNTRSDIHEITEEQLRKTRNMLEKFYRRPPEFSQLYQMYRDRNKEEVLSKVVAIIQKDSAKDGLDEQSLRKACWKWGLTGSASDRILRWGAQEREKIRESYSEESNSLTEKNTFWRVQFEIPEYRRKDFDEDSLLNVKEELLTLKDEGELIYPEDFLDILMEFNVPKIYVEELSEYVADLNREALNVSSYQERAFADAERNKESPVKPAESAENRTYDSEGQTRKEQSSSSGDKPQSDEGKYADDSSNEDREAAEEDISDSSDHPQKGDQKRNKILLLSNFDFVDDDELNDSSMHDENSSDEAGTGNHNSENKAHPSLFDLLTESYNALEDFRNREEADPGLFSDRKVIVLRKDETQTIYLYHETPGKIEVSIDEGDCAEVNYWETSRLHWTGISIEATGTGAEILTCTDQNRNTCRIAVLAFRD